MRAKNPCQSVAYGDCIRRAPVARKLHWFWSKSRKQGADMSDEKNLVENPKANEQELSPKELEGVAGGSLSLNFTKIEMSYVPQNKDGAPEPTKNS
jgi:hypothetical protein